MSKEFWSADTTVSFPEPPPSDVEVFVDFGGFAFTANGITHNISEADVEEMVTPMFAPEGFKPFLDDDIKEAR